MQRFYLLAIIITLSLGAGALWITLIWMESGDTYVDLNKPLPETQGLFLSKLDNHKFRFVVATMWSPEKTFLRYKHFGMKLGQMIEKEETLVIRSSYRETREEIEAAGVDAALVCTGTLLNISGQNTSEVLAVPEFHKGWDYRGMILVTAENPAVSLVDLKGMVMAMTDPESFTGCILPYATMLSVTDDPKEFLKNVVFTGSHDRAVEAVASHLVDSAAVDGLIYDSLCQERPEIRTKTRILWESEPFGPPHILVPASLSSDMKMKLRSALLSYHEDPEGMRILEELNISRFVAPKPGLYDSAKTVFDKVQTVGGCPWR
jgi:phosphonate transport system substrate-binding protein